MDRQEEKEVKRRRRNDLDRYKAKAKKILSTWGWLSKENFEDNVVRMANNMASCSCPMCGNPRKWSKGIGKLTVQEIRTPVEDMNDISEDGYEIPIANHNTGSEWILVDDHFEESVD